MFLRSHGRSKDGKDHTYWSLVETVRTPNGPRQKTLCYLGEVVGSVLLMAGNAAGFYVAAISSIVLFAFLISGAWLLIVGVYEDQAKR